MHCGNFFKYEICNRKIVEKGKLHIHNTEIHQCSLLWLGTGTSMTGGGVKLVY